MLPLENCMLLSSDRIYTCESAGSDARVGRQELHQDFIIKVLRRPVNGFEQRHL